MKCPRCANASLLVANKNGVEIDYCPDCRGIWLERGKLEYIIDQRIGAQRGDNNYYQKREHHDHDDDDDHRDGFFNTKNDDHHRSYGDSRDHKKKSFLGNY